MNPKKITIVGLGLMGGSLAAACRKKFPRARVTGVSRSREALRSALKKKWIHAASRDLAGGVRGADLVILCTPVDTFPRILKEIDRHARPGTLVTDVGSIKGAVLRGRRKNITFVGAHPMVGSHERGLAAANPRLYEGGLIFVIKPEKRAELGAFRKIRGFWNKISHRIVEVSAGRHDKVVGEISHLPHAAAACLLMSVDPGSVPFAASGFRDTTRIAASDPSIWRPIFMGNARAVALALQRFEKELAHFRTRLVRGDGKAVGRFLQKASRRRQQI
ncbi:MAG TPA: prephenate dehydrogenase/arogenate dehydrogenase family protein [Verrucomicrobiae bacterium]|nr:prephenate dehydrogenase/arogenate dehydrogenase family protein [Verrucomicrobiae bacterium]